MSNYFDQFDAPAATPPSAGPLRVTVRPAGATPAPPPTAPPGGQNFFDQFDSMSAGDVTADVAKSAGVGVAKGVIGLAGLPGDIADWGGSALDFATRKVMDFLGLKDEPTAPGKSKLGTPAMRVLPSSGDIQGAVEGVTGQFYKPQTVGGRFAETIGSFVPGAVAGPGGMARNFTNLALIPGIASEGAGQITKGSQLEPWARGGAALAAGGVAALASRPSTPAQALRGQLAPEVTGGAMDRAAQLMTDARARGVPLTWAEAVEQVAPGSGLPGMMRILEGAGDSSAVTRPFFAGRPGHVGDAARRQFGGIAPPSANPSTIGSQAGQLAETAVNDVRDNINTAARPFYRNAEAVAFDPAEWRAVQSRPGFEEARAAVRNDPQLNRYVSHLPDNSIGFVDAMKKYMDAAASNAASPVTAGRNMQRSAGYGADATFFRDSAVNASRDPSRQYAAALAVEAGGRQQFLEPLLRGPLGRLAEKDMTTKRAIEALFPTNPIPNSEHEIATAVSALTRRAPPVAEQLVRAHVESVFNEAARDLRTGPNQFVGADFVSQLSGNPQQRANLEAAIRALPFGDQRWTGFNRFLEVLSATGKREPVGSRTTYNNQQLKDLSTGGLTAGTAKLAASPAKWWSVASDAWGRWQLGNNLEQLAHILTDPTSARMLKAVANMPADSRNVQSVVARLVYIATRPAPAAAKRDPK